MDPAAARVILNPDLFREIQTFLPGTPFCNITCGNGYANDPNMYILKNKLGLEFTPTCVYLACKFGHIEVVKFMIDRGTYIELGCLTIAIEKNHIGAAFCLLNCKKFYLGYMPGYGHSLGHDCLLKACEIGHARLVKKICENIKSNPRHDLNDWINWMAIPSIKSKSIKTVKYLISKGIFIQEDHLKIPAKDGDLEMIKLLEKHVDKKVSCCDAMCVAIKHGHIDIFRYLTRKRNCFPKNIAKIALKYGHPKLAKEYERKLYTSNFEYD